MPRRCTVCDHEERGDIDAALVGASLSFRKIAERYGVGLDAAFRHSRLHVPLVLVESHEAEVAAEATTLLEKVQALEGMAHYWHEEAKAFLLDAKARDEMRGRAAAIQAGTRAVKTIGSVLELLGRVSGELKERPVNVAVLVGSPEWAQVKGRLLDALGPFPEARTAVVAALEPGEAA